MKIPQSVREYLARQQGAFKGRACDGAAGTADAARRLELDPITVAQTTLLRSGSALLLVIHPLSVQPDVERLGRLFKRTFKPAPPELLSCQFPGCATDALPPLPGAFGLRAVVDSSLRDRESIWFAPGTADLLVRADGELFRSLVDGCWWADVSRTDRRQGAGTEMAADVREVRDLPAMPEMAAEILKLRNNPFAHISELAAIVERDPSLTAQVIRYASSPFFGYRGRVDSVAIAIRVLGLDFVFDLAFGLALGRPFRNPRHGPIGLDAFWRHATYTAALCQQLCNSIDYVRRPAPGTAYVAGLLHNFGFLLLGDLFRDQFSRLSRAIGDNPERPVTDLEREFIGVGHAQLGLWLMEQWEMPRELTEAVREHHNPHWESDYGTYANLVLVANRLLARHRIGDERNTDLPSDLLKRLGISRLAAEGALARVIEGGEGLDLIAAELAA